MIFADIDARGNRTEYGYDLLGRLVKVTVKSKDTLTGEMVTAITRSYYDAAGNKVRITDANGKDWTYTYSARGYLLSEKDPLGNITSYQYDSTGNKTAVTDPLNRTTRYEYDQLNQLVKTTLPDSSYTRTEYDRAGNKVKEWDVTGLLTEYTYTPRNLVETVKVGGQLRATYTYDAKGNQVEAKDALNNVTKSDYDSLGRLRVVTHPTGITESFKYDKVGNRIEVTDGRSNSTKFEYNALGWLVKVTDPLWNVTGYQYDLNGNRVKQVAANNLVTTLHYDELNRVMERIDSLGNSTKYAYDPVGNRKWMKDPRGSEWNYTYQANNRLERIDVGNGDETYWVKYTYDAAGNRTKVEDPGNINNYTYDILSRLTEVERYFDGATYKTGYQYSNNLLTGIKYPEASSWLNYNYNELKQLSEVVGFTQPHGIQYETDGALKNITYVNGVVTNYTYDANRRLSSLTATSGSTTILGQSYTYDNAGNITKINDKTYEYDKNNQLIKAVTPGKFLEDKVTPGSSGLATADILGTSGLTFGGDQRAIVSVDTNSTSIGLDFGTVAPGIKKILFVPGRDHITHRVTQKTFDLFVSDDNQKYDLVARDKWEYARDGNGIITITLKERLSCRYLKIHVWFDNRDGMFKTTDKATFLNELGKMLRVYQEAESRTEEYQYDLAGNRTWTQVKLVQTTGHESFYYPNSDRLKTDGKYLFSYDNAGNLVKKEKVNLKEDEPAEVWDYTYDLLNRLVGVKKDGTLISEYGYDPEGLRVVKKAHGETVHYVFEGTEPVFEKNVTTGKTKSYVFALGKHLARVDGVLGDSSAGKYWYTTDHLGSVKAVTDVTGTKVWDADYLAFGQQYVENKIDPGFEEDDLGFTGKGFDSDTGLYYFNARWYDAETGRFFSEDPMMDPNNPNLYSYCRNNPLNVTDPTGNLSLGDIGITNVNDTYKPDIDITPPPPPSTPENNNPGGSPPNPSDPSDPSDTQKDYSINLSNELNKAKILNEENTKLLAEVNDLIERAKAIKDSSDPNMQKTYQDLLSAVQEKLNQVAKNSIEAGENFSAAILKVAKDFLRQKLPYGHSPRPFDKNNNDGILDCSELTYRVYQQALGVDIPQTADAQYQYFNENNNIITSPSGAQVGDIVFFDEPGANKITHVGIVSAVNDKGQIKYIHAPGTGRIVEEKSQWLSMTSPYYSTHFVAFGRM